MAFMGRTLTVFEELEMRAELSICRFVSWDAVDAEDVGVAVQQLSADGSTSR